MAQHYTELIVWQLADDVRRAVFRWTTRDRFAKDRKARSQIDDAASSICRNIAEGFAGSHAQFARYLLIARGSANELTDCIRAAQLKGYVTSADTADVLLTIKRFHRALGRLLDYLSRTPDPPHRARLRNLRRTDERD